jgi:hypothetical protein
MPLLLSCGWSKFYYCFLSFFLSFLELEMKRNGDRFISSVEFVMFFLCSGIPVLRSFFPL